jgi:peptide deformylase
MPILKIVTNPNLILRKKSAEIKKDEITSKKIQRICLNMAKTMLAKEGVGLAAPQIGKNIRLCVVNTKNDPLVLINPKIIKKSWAKEWGEEGCLSVPDVFGEVRRHKKIICDYRNKKGEKAKISAEGLLARVIQHEVDHLDGVLFIDKARNLKEVKNNMTM